MEGKRFVAFADILGFRALLASVPLDEIARRVTDLLAGVAALNVRWVTMNEHGATPGVFRPNAANFSDSIVLWSEVLENFADNQSFATGRMFALSLAELVGHAFVDGIPLRVGVAFGEMYVDTSQNIVLGQPLVDAFDLEEAQNWVGGAFHFSVPLNVIHGDGMAVEYAVPLKPSASVTCCAALDWCYPAADPADLAAQATSRRNFDTALARFLQGASSDSVRQKFENTRTFCDTRVLQNRLNGSF